MFVLYSSRLIHKMLGADFKQIFNWSFFGGLLAFFGLLEGCIWQTDSPVIKTWSNYTELQKNKKIIIY
jgi:hypothetical protein